MMSLSLLFYCFVHIGYTSLSLLLGFIVIVESAGEGVEKGNNREILHSNVQCVEKGNNSVEQTREFREDSSAMEPRGEAQGAQVNNYVIIRGARRVTECALQCIGDNLGSETHHSAHW